MSRKEMKALAKQQIKGKIGAFFVVMLISSLISGAISATGVGAIVSLFINPALSLGSAIIYLKVASDDTYSPNLSDLFSGFKNIMNAFKIYILQAIFVFLWSLLFVIPGIIKAIAYSQVFYILAENPEIGAKEALKRSSDMMNGHKMEYFVMALSFIGWILLSSIALFIPLIWVMPYMNMAFTNFYNNLKNQVNA